MAIPLIDLPDDILIEIFKNISNIRNKVALLRVCKKFNRAAKVALKVQSYQLTKGSDYLYRREEYKDRFRKYQEKILPIRKLLILAPKLTHFKSGLTHFASIQDICGANTEPLNFIHVEEMTISGDITSSTDTNYIAKLKLFLDNSPNLKSLNLHFFCSSRGLTAQWDNKYHLPFSPNLTSFEINVDDEFRYYDDYQFHLTGLYGIITGQAPNLKKIVAYLPYANYNLLEFFSNLSHNCRQLQSLKLEFGKNQRQSSIFTTVPIDSWQLEHFSSLTHLEITGLEFEAKTWSMLLSKCPSLQFLALEENINQGTPQAYFL